MLFTTFNHLGISFRQQEKKSLRSDITFKNQAGVVESLETLVKEFVSAANDEKKTIFSQLEQEVGKLEGSAARS